MQVQTFIDGKLFDLKEENGNLVLSIYDGQGINLIDPLPDYTNAQLLIKMTLDAQALDRLLGSFELFAEFAGIENPEPVEANDNVLEFGEGTYSDD